MKKQFVLDAWTDFQEGDVTVSISPGHGTITVEREIAVEDNYAEGTALQIVDSQGDPLVLFKMRASAMAEIGARYDEEWLALYSDGSMGAVPFVYYAEEIEASKKTGDATW